MEAHAAKNDKSQLTNNDHTSSAGLRIAQLLLISSPIDVYLLRAARHMTNANRIPDLVQQPWLVLAIIILSIHVILRTVTIEKRYPSCPVGPSVFG
jgi:hypothetical protein